MYEKGSKIALNSTCSKGFKIKEAYLSLSLCYLKVFVAVVSFAAVISVVTQLSSPLSGEDRCVTTLITAAKETIVAAESF